MSESEKVSPEAKFSEEPKLSFIVPIYKVSKDTLKRCLMSLDDQDYPNIEVVCVMDGVEDDEAKDLQAIAVKFAEKQPERVKAIEIAHAGACAARNAGFQASTGEIVSFFNSDYVAKPGMARMWVNALQANLDCGFVYGAYEYSAARRWWYISKPFDSWLLKIANYIDCGFPLWRKHVVEWDPECKSLQDWDFWLRVVAKGVKGHYLGRTISFVAEPPRAGGLSVDSHSNWSERIRYIKEKNGIPISDICVTSLGAPVHGVEIAKMLGADYRDDTIYKPHNYKALYLIGWYMKPTDQGNEHPSILMHFDKPGISKIVHFVGADIFWLRKFNYESMKALAGALNLKATHILCETDIAQRELADFGIKAKILPIPSYSSWEMKPLPDEFKMSVFLTEKSDFDKYCYEHTLSIIRAMPDVQFTAYGDGGKDVAYPNLKHYGTLTRKEWEEYVYANSCYLRLVRHDTLPMASCEFIMAGRDVVTNLPLPYQEYIDTRGKMELNDWDMYGSGLNVFNWPETKKAIIKRIRAIRAQRAGNYLLTDRVEAAGHYNQILDKGRYIEKIRALSLGKEVPHADKQLETTAVAGH